MADRSAIEWTDATWNPVVGCSILSPGCARCYAMPMAARIERMQPGSHYAGTTQPSKAGPVWTGKLALAPEHILTQPLRWRRPRRIFVNSMGDLFHESAPDEWIDRVFAVMALTPQHTYQVLTKRSARMREYVGQWLERLARNEVPVNHPTGRANFRDLVDWHVLPAVLPNVWLGVSTEVQRRTDERVPDLLATPAAVRFVSAEPLLGAIDFRRIKLPSGALIDTLASRTDGPYVASPALLNLIIVGGESGPNARPMRPSDVRSLRDQCAATGVAFFFKQWGEWAPEEHLSDEQAAATYEADFKAGRTWRYTGEPMRRLGKHHRAGRLLDGVEHNAMPEVR